MERGERREERGERREERGERREERGARREERGYATKREETRRDETRLVMCDTSYRSDFLNNSKYGLNYVEHIENQET